MTGVLRGLGAGTRAPRPARSGAPPAARGLIVNRSPLARRIVAYNLAALVVLVTGVLYLDPFRDSLVVQRENSIATEAGLIAAAIEARLPWDGATDADLADALARTPMPSGLDVFLLGPDGRVIARAEAGIGLRLPETGPAEIRRTVLTSALNGLWARVDGLLGRSPGDADRPGGSDAAGAAALVAPVLARGGTVLLDRGARDHSLWVGTPIGGAGAPVGVLAAATSAERVEALANAEREQVLQMFVVAILVSVGVSLALASTIATPLSLLSAAAEIGRHRGRGAAARVRIPDLTSRTDEIGRLSGALRGMVAALYDRIDANEQFAADVAHEIKNPLASLRSATGTLRVAVRPEQRERLLQVIDHDVRRLDRLVSDISNASRLDAELVKEEEEPFDLLDMLRNLAQFLGQDARDQGIAFLTDLPDEPIAISGLEARLAQVFVNLITNAISFCEEGDAIRMWVRRNGNRVLVVVEDTGPGIPDAALKKVFARFYSERPEGQFGNNSGLGLAISKQIVDAHGGVVWAENIRPTEADPTSEPLGARFVVGLPV